MFPQEGHERRTARRGVGAGFHARNGGVDGNLGRSGSGEKRADAGSDGLSSAATEWTSGLCGSSSRARGLWQRQLTGRPGFFLLGSLIPRQGACVPHKAFTQHAHASVGHGTLTLGIHGGFPRLPRFAKLLFRSC
jgi:hypothetical protein